MHVKILQKKWNCWKCVACKFSFVYLQFDSLRRNSLTTIDILSLLGGAVVMHPLWRQEVPCWIPGSGKGFYVWLFLFCCCCFYFLSKNTLFDTKGCNSFCKVNLFSILNVLQHWWPIIRVYRNKPRILNSWSSI